MKILVLNSGSSSIKYQFIDISEGNEPLAKGSVTRIGMKGAILDHKRQDGDSVKIVGEIIDHQAAIEYILAILLSPNHGVIKNREEIEAVGHRVVHGGEEFTDSVEISPEVMNGLHECIELAPLHNPHNIKGIQACQKLLKNIPMVGVFDTVFHHKIPDYAYIYGLPYLLYKRYGIRRYGFHGTSHYYVSQRAALLAEKPISELKMITVHLGNGCSIAAVDGGVSIDTSMGFTPLEGLLMGTRSGDIDAGAVMHIMSREELSLGEINTLLNKHSGLMGISGTSSDMREITEEMEDGNDRSRLAFQVFSYRVKKYIGAYAAAMGGLDVIVFTGGIGENSQQVRKETLSGMQFLSIDIEENLNNSQVSGERKISTESSQVSVYVIPTNEELVIAQETERIINQKNDV
ncbi:MAG: acetate kinase [Candidatus Electryonea clarkiae]|nr:acetate kinase [Candidatus Electryonea clarkiae]MDP8285789.1 acetate kinase [Candidatus Electryonea clarkiae]